jgi:hypothetical protein
MYPPASFFSASSFYFDLELGIIYEEKEVFSSNYDIAILA